MPIYGTAVKWANAYKKLINEDAVRALIIKCNDVYGDVTYGVRTHLDSGRGTVYQDYGDRTAHFMAYAIRTDDVLIYDPAGGDSQFAVSPRDMPKHVRKLRAIFKKRIVMDSLYHQIEDGDTWCQTWSFAWIDNSLRSYVSVIPEDYMDARETMKFILVTVLSRMVAIGLPTARDLLADFQSYYVHKFHEFY